MTDLLDPSADGISYCLEDLIVAPCTSPHYQGFGATAQNLCRSYCIHCLSTLLVISVLYITCLVQALTSLLKGFVLNIHTKISSMETGATIKLRVVDDLLYLVSLVPFSKQCPE